MNIYGVKFSDRGKIYYFNAENLNVRKNMNVIVETEKGLQYGKVVEKVDFEKANSFQNIKNIVRLTTKDDYKQYLNNLKEAEQALHKLADELKLEMRFLTASFTFDKKQLLFNFTADERVDFRDLTKKLASIYRTRIELRQIGARDKASIVGGIGQCGKELCCNTFLKTLESVSMNMAKNQNLALTPSKINGCCGRLLCCLAYEDESYQEARKGMPNIGDKINYEGKQGKVVAIDILNRKVKIDSNNELVEINLTNESN